MLIGGPTYQEWAAKQPQVTTTQEPNEDEYEFVYLTDEEKKAMDPEERATYQWKRVEDANEHR
jgi:hypothetical protein